MSTMFRLEVEQVHLRNVGYGCYNFCRPRERLNRARARDLAEGGGS